MKLFKFPLESLRTLNKQKERVAQQNYARALAARDAAGVLLQAADRALAAAWETLALELSDGAAAALILGRRAWCTMIETRRNECQAALDEARRATDTRLREMVAAARKR